MFPQWKVRQKVAVATLCTLWLVALQAVAKGYALTLRITLHAESANSIQNRSFLAIPLN